jgi:arachidonate 15-lipoxygenase
MSAFIPQLDPDPELRQADLDRARSEYQFNYTYVSPLAIIERVPITHEFSHEWLKLVGDRVLTALHNQLEIEGETHLADFLCAKHGLLEKILAIGADFFAAELRAIVTEALRFTGRMTAKPVRPTDLEDFAKLFRTIGLPPVAQAASEGDRSFAHMRLAGPNPVMLRRVAKLDDRFPVDEELFRSVVPGDSLAAAGAQGRLFLADYRALDGAELSNFPNDIQKYLYAPLALFVVDRATRELRPVAIQCKQAPGPDNPIFTPDDGYNWRIAKTIVEIADGNIHEPVTHLARTHLLIEPFVVCTYRQLAPNHPLFLLLAPHFEGTLAINDAAWRHLIAHKGAVDKLCAGTIKASCKLAADGVRTYLFNEAMLPRALADRGVADSEWLVDYPYRDDATLYWGAIHRWVSEYLSLYYPGDAEVAADPELSAWLAEIGAEDGGRISGFGTTGSPTLGYLVEAVTMIIYTCSVQHAAVNFPQYDLMSYVPNMPLASYAPAPTTKKGATAADHLAMLPPLDIAELQMELGYMLGTVHYTTLGQYPEDYFEDPRVAAPLARFQFRLEEIGHVLDRRNAERMPYPFLAPSGIPQSINI